MSQEARSQQAPPAATTPTEEALTVAARAAKRHGVSEPEFRASVTSIDHVPQTYGRALHVIERRRVVLKQDPGLPTRTRKLAPMPDPGGVDPWDVDVASLPEETRVIAECPGCRGEKHRTCGHCSGTARRSCGGCSGSGRVAGAKGRRKNCPTCRARGDVKCTACRGGKVDCTQCGADGRVDAWLEVERQPLTQVHAHPANESSALHSQLGEAADFDAPPRAWPGRLTADSGARTPPFTCPEPLRARLEPGSDRLVSTRLQDFASDLYRIHYATARRTGRIEVAGQRLQIPSTSDWAPLSHRRRATRALGAILALAAGVLWLTHNARHPWYWQYGHGFLVALSALVAAFCASKALAHHLLAPRVRSETRVKQWSGAAGACALAALCAFALDGPRVQAAQDARASGDKARARMEAEALRALDIAPDEGARVLDALHLEEVQAATSPLEQARLLRQDWYEPAVREQALARLQTTTRSTAETAFNEQRASALDELARAVDGLLPDAPLLRGRASLVRASQCLVRKEFLCVGEELASGAGAQMPAAEREALRASYIEALASARAEALQRASTLRDWEAQRQALQQAIAWSEQLVQQGNDSGPPLASLTQRVSKLDEQIAVARRAAEEKAAREQARQERLAAQRAQSEENAEDVQTVSYGGDYSGGGRVHVRGYTRKDGTYVSPHTRRRRR